MADAAVHPPILRHHRLRALVAVAFVFVVIAAAASDTVHGAGEAIVERVEPIILAHPRTGALVFLLLSAISAMVVFFSAAVLTPIAVNAFGPAMSFLLLWAGWIIGGIAAWTIGRFFGEQFVSWFVSLDRLRTYEAHARRLSTFSHVLLFQLAVPSEVPGYLLGLVGCRFRTFAAAMALAELPFALGAIYLGEGFLKRNYWLLLVVGACGIAITSVAVRRFLASHPRESDPPARSQTAARGLSDAS